MADQDDFHIFWSNVAQFLNQQELCKLAQTSSKMNRLVAQPRLYGSIHVTKNPVQRVPDCYLDCGTTYISGYRATVKSDDQNDIYLYDRLERFIDSLEQNSALIKNFIIDNHIFSSKDSGVELLDILIPKIVGIETIESVVIKSHPLFLRYSKNILNLENLRYLRLHNNILANNELRMPNLSSIKLTIDETYPGMWCNDNLTPLLTDQIQEMHIELDDFQISSWDFFESLRNTNIIFKNVNKLKFNMVHINNEHIADGDSYGNVIAHSLVTHFHLSTIRKLEIEFCCHFEQCPCIDEFLLAISPELESLGSVALKQTLYHNKGVHQKHEDFDGSAGNFLQKLPHYSTQLKELCIHHDPPLNGIGIDTVEGNYYRRRRFYENLLPQLKSLEKLIVPQMLQSLSLYEIIACDILWNGCVCEHCKRNLPQFDDYLMNHQYFSKSSGKYEDVIPPVLFGYTGDTLYKRYSDIIEWEFDSLKICPVSTNWNFHGYENVHHFEENKCSFNENKFKPLVTGVTHFFNDYMDNLVQYLPNLKVAVLSGIYYTISPEKLYPFKNISRRYKAIYD